MNLNNLTPAKLDWKTWPDWEFRATLYDALDITEFMNTQPKARWVYGADRRLFYDLYIPVERFLTEVTPGI